MRADPERDDTRIQSSREHRHKDQTSKPREPLRLDEEPAGLFKNGVGIAPDNDAHNAGDNDSYSERDESEYH